MTTPESDQELARLFTVAREATMPDPGARARVRAGVARRLAPGAPTAPRAWARRTWAGVGIAVLGLGATLWLRVEPRTGSASAIPTPNQTPRPQIVTTAPPLGTASSSTVEARPASAELASATPSLQLRKPAPPSNHDADPSDELGLVRAMQQALRSGDASRALALAGEHGRRFPRGTLAEEREGVRAVAQCQLAAPSERATILQTFVRRHPSSPYAPRVKAVCQ
jgi:hypothetical protein